MCFLRRRVHTTRWRRSGRNDLGAMTSTVYIAKNVYGGDGLGRLGDGRVVFVPGAFAGENVKAEIVEERRSFVKARLVEVVEASPCRTGTGPEPIPGMVYANLSYAAELDAKEAQLKEALERARLSPGGFSRIDCSQEPLNYRNKVVYHFAKQGGDWALGYRKEPGHEIVDITSDPLARPEINAKLPEIRRHAITLLTQGAESVRRDTERKGNITVRWTPRSGVQWWIGDAPKGLALKEVTCGRVFEVPAGGFYQVNPVAGESLVKAVVDEYAKGVDVAPNILDLYCGVGVFGLSCAHAAKTPDMRLVGVESGLEAIDFAKRNAAAQVAQGMFFAEEVGRNMKRIKIGARSTVVVDPPRGGLEKRVPEWLAASRAPRIMYVSCDPATLVRDLRVICRGYDLDSVRWVDMFPRTARFETLAILRKRA